MRSVVVYFTLALCLLARLPYQEAMDSVPCRRRGHRAGGAGDDGADRRPAQARERLLELLFWRVAGVLLPSRDPWATVGGLLVAAWDGTTLKVPASPENIAALALAAPRRRETATTPAAGKGREGAASGRSLPADAGRRPDRLRHPCPARGGHRPPGRRRAETRRHAHRAPGPGMLLLADRGFWSLALWQAVHRDLPQANSSIDLPTSRRCYGRFERFPRKRQLEPINRRPR